MSKSSRIRPLRITGICASSGNVQRLSVSRLRRVAAVSGVYDVAVGAAMLLGRSLLARLFDVALPTPPINADLNGVFLLAVGLGYLIPFRDPAGGRGYLWVMGPFLKGAGAITFLLDTCCAAHRRRFCCSRRRWGACGADALRLARHARAASRLGGRAAPPHLPTMVHR